MDTSNLTIGELKEIKSRIEGFTDFTKNMYYLYHNNVHIEQIERMKNNGIYISKQFVDLDTDLSTEEYNKWLKSVKKTFMHTIHTNSLLMGSDTDKIKEFHSQEELSTPVLAKYSPNQIMETLEWLDIYTIMLLLAEDVQIEIIGKETYLKENIFLTGIHQKEDGSVIKLASRPHIGGKSISSLDENGKINYNFVNANEFLFRNLKLPIKTVLNSVNEAVDFLQFSNEGIKPDVVNEELCEQIVRIRKSDTYEELREESRKKGRRCRRY